MRSRSPLPSARRPVPHSRGFTLLEVLVAIVVLSFGVLGVVGLQAAALQANKEARYQSAAVAFGRELGDMMRGNKGVANANTTTNPYLGDFSGAPPSTTADCFTSAACATTLAVAQFNIREWLTRVQATLPGARVVVCFDDTPYDANGRPQWTCSTTPVNKMAVVKMGWTRQSTDRSASSPDIATGAGAAAPMVVLPLTPGS